MTNPQYIEQINQWHADKEASLRAPDGWLSLAGLFWLNEGINRVGSDPSNEIVLPASESMPPFLGSLELNAGKITLHSDSALEINGEQADAGSYQLAHDHESKKPSIVTLGSVKFHIIERTGSYGVRVRDANNPARQTFSGRAWFPIDDGYHVIGQFIAHNEPAIYEVDNSIGTSTMLHSSGMVEFVLNGETHRLVAFDESDGVVSIYIRDATSGKSTYPAGRFIVATVDEEGAVDLDFNKAYFPPCAFTAYATCPYPPRDNFLKIAIPVGERFP